jgi:hypothetical protein
MAHLKPSHFACDLVSQSGATYRKQMPVTKRTSILFLTLAISVASPCLAQTPEPFEVRRAEAAFEELPELNASEILKPELLKGPHYVVRDPVPTASGMNHSQLIQTLVFLKRTETKCSFNG